MELGASQVDAFESGIGQYDALEPGAAEIVTSRVSHATTVARGPRVGTRGLGRVVPERGVSAGRLSGRSANVSSCSRQRARLAVARSRSGVHRRSVYGQEARLVAGGGQLQA